MVKSKTKSLLVLLGIFVVVIGYYNIFTNINMKVLSHNQLTNSINQYWFQGKAINFAIEAEKDVEDLHLLLLSYQPNPSSSQQTGLVVFERLANDNYRYKIFLQSSPVVLVAN